jgi:hypothetical protein
MKLSSTSKKIATGWGGNVYQAKTTVTARLYKIQVRAQSSHVLHVTFISVLTLYHHPSLISKLQTYQPDKPSSARTPNAYRMFLVSTRAGTEAQSVSVPRGTRFYQQKVVARRTSFRVDNEEPTKPDATSPPPAFPAQAARMACCSRCHTHGQCMCKLHGGF